MSAAGIMTAIFLFVIGISIIGIILMLALIGKNGDERKKYIITKAGHNSFLVLIGVFILAILENTIRVLFQQQLTRQINPFIILIVAAIVFLIQLAYLNKRYGG